MNTRQRRDENRSTVDRGVVRLDPATLDVVPDAIVTLGRDGSVGHANAAAIRLLGCGGLAGAALETFVAPGSRDLWAAFRAMLADMAQGGSAPVDLDFVTAHGTVPCEVILVPVPADPEGRVLAILRDATALRQRDEAVQRMLSDMDEHRLRVEAQAAEFIHQAEALSVSEQRLSLILASTRDAYWDWNIDTGLIEFNTHFAEALGLDHDTTERMDRFLERVHPAEQVAVRAALSGVETQQDVDVVLGEFRLYHASGRAMWVYAKGQIVARGDDGRARRAVGMLHDINERKVRDEEQQRLRRLEAVGGLAAGVAHEINTPLQLVGDNLTFLADNLHYVTALLEGMERIRADIDAWSRWRTVAGDLLAEDVEADLAYVRAEFPLAVRESIEGIDRVSRIVRALKEFAHPGQADREMVDLRRIVDNAITLTRNEWKYVAEIVTDYGDLPETFQCSAGECGQLFVNLIVNAAQAIASEKRDTKGTIAIRARCSAGECVVEVTDDGPGMPADVQARAFDPFFTTKPVGQGSGQGLALARAVVERHGGAISVESAIGRGTTFTIRMPLGPEAGAVPAA
ncbi:MAG: ATP-binding protein [Vicinamibacterales bacterium]